MHTSKRLDFFEAILKYKNNLSNADMNRIIYLKDTMNTKREIFTYSSAHKALGLNPSSNTCNRYIDTSRLYKNKFIFSSKPIDSASRD